MYTASSYKLNQRGNRLQDFDSLPSTGPRANSNEVPKAKQLSYRDSLFPINQKNINNTSENAQQISRLDKRKDSGQALTHFNTRYQALGAENNSFVESNHNSNKNQNTSWFAKNLGNLKLKKSDSNRAKDVQKESGNLSSPKDSGKNNSFVYRKKSSIFDANDNRKDNSDKEMSINFEKSKEERASNPQKSSAKVAHFFSTPKMPLRHSSSSGLGGQPSGTRTKTTGNMYSTTTRTPRNSVLQEYIMTITENRAKEIGIAAFNVITGEIIISQISDNHTYVNSMALIFRFYPIEIIFPQTQENSLLFVNVQKKFKNVAIKLIKKTFFDETKGCFIYSQSATTHGGDLDSKYLGFAALNALCSYLEFARGTVLFYPSLKIDFHYNEHFMLIDLATIESLELLLNNKTKTPSNSLIECFECQTVGGSRLLRASLLQPLNNKARIEERFDAVDELLDKQELLVDLKKVLKSFDQCDNVTAKFIQKFNENDKKAIKQLYINIVSLFHMLTGIDSLVEVLDHFKSNLFIHCLKTLSDQRIEEIISDIKSKLHVEAKTNGNEKFRQKLYYLVKNDTNEFLDLARVYYTRLTSEIYQLHQKYQQVLQTRDLQLIHQDSRGYCLFITHNLLNKYSLEQIEFAIEDRFVQVNKKGKGCLVKTKLIESLNNRIKESCNEILNQTQKANRTLQGLLETIHSRITILFNISEAIAQIDMILAFVNYKLGSSYTYSKYYKSRPHFDNELGTLAINQSRHPVLEKNSFVPNNYLFTPNNPVSLVFGRASSGKTVYVKQIALLCILSQIGCPIPCESATLLIFDRLFARMGTNDNLELNESSLYFELNQCYNIFLNIVDKSNQIKFRTLVISDGFAKSTSSEESFSITFSFIERFLLFNNVNLILTANDFQILTVAAMYKFIGCIQMKSERLSNKVVNQYRAERIDYHSLQDYSVKDIELLNMPKEFRVEFQGLLSKLSDIEPPVSVDEELEERYLEKVKEFLIAYSQITMKLQTPEQRAAELLHLKRIYFKDITSS